MSGIVMAGEGACIFDGGSSGQETPVGFRDSPGQWYTANHRRRSALSQLEGEPTQRDSQATEVATQPADGLAPLFVAASPSQGENDDQDEVDEEETQIRMTNSEEQDGATKPDQVIFEEAVHISRASTASGRGGFLAGIENSDDDADSDMSDDMLGQDGSYAGLSSIAASFQREEEEEKSVMEKRIFKPRTSFRASPALSICNDSDSSGGETEIEGEPKEESPSKSQTAQKKGQLSSNDSLTLCPAKRSVSYSKSTVKEDSPPRNVTCSLSTPEKKESSVSSRHSSKREQGGSPEGSYGNAKRSRLGDARSSLYLPHSLDQTISSKKQNALEKSDENIPHDHPTDKVSNDIQGDKGNLSAEVVFAEESSSTSPRLAPRSQRNAPASIRGKKRAASSRSVTDSESVGSQAEAGSIRVVLTGLEPTTAIRMKIKAIAGAVYESNVVKATHVIAPEHQLKRTVKLLCGISCCTHILGERWLDESARAGVAVDEQAKCLRDKEAEDKWQFDLRSTMYDVPSTQRQRLLAGYSVFITNHKSVLPPVKDLVKIVECAGGKASSKGKPGGNDLVITSEAALAVSTVRKQLVSANPDRIYSSELILSSILQQRIELGKHRLELRFFGMTWATKCQK